MCSELFHIPISWGGVPIFGVGVLLALWTLTSAMTVVGLVRRYGWSSETVSSLPVMLLVAAVILFLPRVFPDGMPIRGYGIMLLAGIVSGVAMAMYRGRQGGLDLDLVLSMAIWIIVAGVIGARVFHVVEYWDERFAGKSLAATILEIVNIPEGGLVIFGAFFGAALCFIALVRKHGLPLLAMADLAAPCMLIGLALGRIGCLLNGCCYGGQTDRPWAVTFPKYSSPYEIAKSQGKRRYSPPYSDQAMRGELHGFRLESSGNDLAPHNPLPVPVSGRERVTNSGAVVARVDPTSPAAAAGLQAGDEVIAINGVRISSLAIAKEIVFANFEAQQPLRLELQGGKTIEIAPVPPPDRSRPVHPAQLYSAVDAGLLCWLLWSFYPFRWRDGQCLALLLTIHPVTRFLLEIIRTDEPAVFGTGMSISQNISLVLLACGIALWWYLSRQPRGIVWPLATDAGRRGPTAAPATARASRQRGTP
jgi:phosphatidylglycerol:prolipoprotein diacylglycerol transferase